MVALNKNQKRVFLAFIFIAALLVAYLLSAALVFTQKTIAVSEEHNDTRWAIGLAYCLRHIDEGDSNGFSDVKDIFDEGKELITGTANYWAEKTYPIGSDLGGNVSCQQVVDNMPLSLTAGKSSEQYLGENLLSPEFEPFSVVRQYDVSGDQLKSNRDSLIDDIVSFVNNNPPSNSDQAERILAHATACYSWRDRPYPDNSSSGGARDISYVDGSGSTIYGRIKDDASYILGADLANSSAGLEISDHSQSDFENKPKNAYSECDLDKITDHQKNNSTVESFSGNLGEVTVTNGQIISDQVDIDGDGISGGDSDIITGGSSSGGLSGTTGTPEETCESKVSIGWITCAFFKYTTGFLDGSLDEDIGNDLRISLDEDDPNIGSIKDVETVAKIKAAWGSFRVISNIVLVIGLLVVIFGKTFGLEAYSVKKMAPRIVVSAILVQLSWFLSVEVMSFVDTLGTGASDLIYSAFGIDDPLEIEAPIGLIDEPGFWTKITLAGFVTLFGILLPIALAVLAFVLIIEMRKVLVIALILLGPIAAALWVVPGLDNYAKLWWKWYWRSLIFYVVAMIILSLTKSMSNLF